MRKPEVQSLNKLSIDCINVKVFQFEQPVKHKTVSNSPVAIYNDTGAVRVLDFHLFHHLNEVIVKERVVLVSSRKR